MYPTLYALIDFLRQLFELLLRLHKLPTSVDVAIWVHLFEVVVLSSHTSISIGEELGLYASPAVSLVSSLSSLKTMDKVVDLEGLLMVQVEGYLKFSIDGGWKRGITWDDGAGLKLIEGTEAG